MDFLLFFKSAFVGFSIAAPVGPVGLLCIQRTLTSGFGSGLISGLGAASADAVYGAIGAFGLTAAMLFFAEIRLPLTLAGAVFLLWLGYRLLVSETVTRAAETGDVRRGRTRDFLSVFALTLSSPVTIFSFIAVFAAISGHQPESLSADEAGVMIVGVFAGSALWWLLLSSGVHLVRHRLKPSIYTGISRIAGIALIGFALWQLMSLL